MEDTHTFPSLQCARAPVFGTAPHHPRHLPEDAHSAATCFGKKWRRQPKGTSGSPAKSGVHADKRWGCSSSGASCTAVLGGITEDGVFGQKEESRITSLKPAASTARRLCPRASLVAPNSPSDPPAARCAAAVFQKPHPRIGVDVLTLAV
jgi:hypothetical protein